MVYRSGVFSKRAGMPFDQFSEHWRIVHGALAAKMPGLHDYRQNHITRRLYELSPFPGHSVDGISQLRFDDIHAMEVAEGSTAYSSCKEDIPLFQGAITILVLEQQSVITTPYYHDGSSSKLILLSSLRNKRIEKFSPTDLPTLAMRDGGDMTSPLRFVFNSVIDRSHPVQAGVAQGDLPIEAISEFWFESEDHLQLWFDSSVGREWIFSHPTLVTMAAYSINELKIC